MSTFFQGIDLSLLIKILFVFEGSVLWKGAGVLKRSVSQNIDGEKVCENYHNSNDYKGKGILYSVDQLKFSCLVCVFKVLGRISDFFEKINEVLFEKTPVVLAFIFPVGILLYSLKWDVSKIGSTHSWIIPTIGIYILSKAFLYVLSFVVNLSYLALYKKHIVPVYPPVFEDLNEGDLRIHP